MVYHGGTVSYVVNTNNDECFNKNWPTNIATAPLFDNKVSNFHTDGHWSEIGRGAEAKLIFIAKVNPNLDSLLKRLSSMTKRAL